MQPSQTLPRTDSSTLRLLYPQWQGGDVASWFKDLSPKEAAQGYVLGAQILNLLVNSIAPSANTAVVNIEKDFMLDSAGQRVAQEGIIDKAPLLRQTKAAFEILKARKPAKILTLGGECAVSVPSFCYLVSLYDDVALVWLDAHPDIGLPNDDFYQGYHAMAVSAIIGQGGLQETFNLPSRLESSKVLLVGLHSDEARHYAPRQKEFGLASLAPNDVAKDSSKILGWLAKSGVKRVMIHLDLDVLDARELYVAVGNTGQMSLEQVMRVINDIAAQYEVVGLTIAEHMPKAHIQLRRLLENLPLVKE